MGACKTGLGLIASAFLLLAGPAAADAPPDNVEYDIVRYQDSLTIWLNLNRYIGEAELESLLEGIGFALEWKTELQRPRKLWGAETVAEVSSGLTITHRPVTEDFEVLSPGPDSAVTRRIFLTRSDLRRFLSDSVLIALAPLKTLSRRPHYRARLEIERISLTSINLAADGDVEDSDDSPLKFLFRQFLIVTGYGRETFSTTSRTFRLSEVDSLR